MRTATRTALAAAILAWSVDAYAQVPSARAIAGRPVEFATPFSEISSLLELADGTVLVHDATERKLGVADLRTGVFREVARLGAGPLEYRAVASLVRVAGDSVLLWDPANARVLVLAPSGAPTGARIFRDRQQRRLAFGRNAPRETDAGGRWYGSFREVTTGDSTAVVRIVPAEGTQDTLARYSTPQLRPRRSSAGVVQALAPGFPPQDAWGVFPDGRVLLIHGASYTPEVIRPDGARVMAPAIAFPRLAITDDDRREHLRLVAKQLERMLGRELGPAGGALPRVEALAPERWQQQRAPVLGDVIRVDSRLRAWVHALDREPEAGDRYDLLDADGRRIDAIRLPRGVRLVGMGRGVLYGAREDGDGLLHLQRYPLP